MAFPGLTLLLLHSQSKISQEQEELGFFLCYTTAAFAVKRTKAFFRKLAETMQTWQWQMIYSAEPSCRFSHLYSVRGFMPLQHCSGCHMFFTQLMSFLLPMSSPALCQAVHRQKSTSHTQPLLSTMSVALDASEKKRKAYIPIRWNPFITDLCYQCN